MHKSQLFFLILFFIGNHILAQKEFTIFNEKKVFTYDAFFIEKSGDTLTREILALKGNENSWQFQKTQTELEIFYEPDSSALVNFVYPLKAERERIKRNLSKAKTKKSWANYTWLMLKETTGKIENDTIIWLHPPRSNQYIYTYLSAYPEVRFNELKIGGNWQSKISIAKGFPNNEEFVGTVTNNFIVRDYLTTTTVAGNSIENCWIIESSDKHSKLGESYSTFIFDEKYYGFIRMEFEYYNGIKIIFNLKEVTMIK
jgi:outer membrane lipoprotein-sorting protein